VRKWQFRKAIGASSRACMSSIAGPCAGDEGHVDGTPKVGLGRRSAKKWLTAGLRYQLHRLISP